MYDGVRNERLKVCDRSPPSAMEEAGGVPGAVVKGEGKTSTWLAMRGMFTLVMDCDSIAIVGICASAVSDRQVAAMWWSCGECKNSFEDVAL